MNCFWKGNYPFLDGLLEYQEDRIVVSTGEICCDRISTKPSFNMAKVISGVASTCFAPNESAVITSTGYPGLSKLFCHPNRFR